jgi:hypothetical protein
LSVFFGVKTGANPQDVPEEDIFICESRYMAKAKAIARIKLWGKPLREVLPPA